MAETTTGTTSTGPSGGESGTNTSTTTSNGGTTTGDAGGGIGKPDGTLAPAPAPNPSAAGDNPGGADKEKEHAALQAAVGAHDRSFLSFLEETATKVELIFEDEYHEAKAEVLAAWARLKAAIKPVVSNDDEDTPTQDEDENPHPYGK